MFTRPYSVLIVIALLLGGCAMFGVNHLQKLYGPAAPVAREVATLAPSHVDFWREVKPVLDNRCVVCHGCYDSPCQLKLTAIEGIDRGANKTPLYNNRRLLPDELTRLFEDAQTVEQWRQKDFFPVLNEREQTPEANRRAGVMHQLLTLKSQHPLPDEPLLPASFTLNLGRENVCPKAEEFDEYAGEHPLWGMPYALPALNNEEQRTLLSWIEQGATYTARAPVPAQIQQQVEQWEAFFNQGTVKSKLVSRYLFEHLFLAHIHFGEASPSEHFRMVRSTTPPGVPVERISTRRPYDPPPSKSVYYRLVPELETIVSKTHMPYALDEQRMQRWQQWFFDAEYEVTSVPGYNAATAANPFIVFSEIPPESRYRFLLDEAHYTIKNFINGPVCRGPVALSVIRDHFWVFFMNPDSKQEAVSADFLSQYEEELALPSAEGNIYTPLTTWLKYSKKQKQYLTERDKYLSRNLGRDSYFDLNTLWQGGRENPNVALTVFRHYDSASVEKGMLGERPQTAWLIGYPLLERIHYLLVAGYDVYGNVGHQLLSRLHMDFLRMEGEANFLMLLPKQTRDRERHNWYREVDEEVLQYLTHPSLEQNFQPAVNFTSDDHKGELYNKLRELLAPALQERNSLDTVADEQMLTHLRALSQSAGKHTRLLAEVSFLEVYDAEEESQFFTLIRNNAHLNMTALLSEKKTLLPQENTVTVARHLIASYPNAFLRVPRDMLPDFVAQVLALKNENDYRQLMDSYGIRRTSEQFWWFSDRLHEYHRQNSGTEYGLFDLSRLENR